MSAVQLGLRENWRQFALLILVNAFVGGMVGIERTVVPLIGVEEFGIASTTLVVSFIVSFGVVKAFVDLVSGQLADRWGRKRVLVLGWLFGPPVPFMILFAPSWNRIIAANALLGISQGFAWSMTVIMKVDLVGPKGRGLAVGLNEFAGYFAVGLTALLTGWLAAEYGLRPVPIYLGVGYAILGTVLSILLVRDTRGHVRMEAAAHAREESPLTFREVFALTSFRDRNLFAASQAGLVNNLNDGMSWGHLSAVLRRRRPRRGADRHPEGGLPRHLGTAPDRHRTTQRPLGTQGADRGGHVGAGRRLAGDRSDGSVRVVAARQHPARRWHRDGLSEPDRRGVGCFASFLARPLAQRLPFLARPRLRHRRAIGGADRRYLRPVGGDRLDRCSDLRLGNLRTLRDGREPQAIGSKCAIARPTVCRNVSRDDQRL